MGTGFSEEVVSEIEVTGKRSNWSRLDPHCQDQAVLKELGENGWERRVVEDDQLRLDGHSVINNLTWVQPQPGWPR